MGMKRGQLTKKCICIPFIIFGKCKKNFELFKNYSLVAQLISLLQVQTMACFIVCKYIMIN